MNKLTDFFNFKFYFLGQCGDCGENNQDCIRMNYINDASFDKTFRLNNNEMPFFIQTSAKTLVCGKFNKNLKVMNQLAILIIAHLILQLITIK